VAFCDKSKKTAFEVACIHAFNDVVLILLDLITDDTKHLLDISYFCFNHDYFTTPFHRRLSHETTIRLIERLPFAKELIQWKSSYGGYTALRQAVIDASRNLGDGRLIATSFITRELAEIDCLDHFDRTPLYDALGFKNVPTVELLLRFGCRTDNFDKTGLSALKLLLTQNNWADFEDRGTNLKLVELLLAFGVDLRKEPYLYSDEEMPDCFNDQYEVSHLKCDTTDLHSEMLETLSELRRSCAMETLQRLCRTNIRRHLKYKADGVISSLSCLPNRMRTFFAS